MTRPRDQVAVFERMFGFSLKIRGHVWVIGLIQYPALKDIYSVQRVLGKERVDIA